MGSPELLSPLAQSVIVNKLSAFIETLTVVHLVAFLAVSALTVYLVARKRPDLIILLMFATSLFTTASHPGVANATYLGRWYFLILGAFTALLRPKRAYMPIVALAGVWAFINLFGLLYSPVFEKGAVRVIFFFAAIPAFLMSMGPPNVNLNDLIQFIRRLAWLGVPLAVLHFLFIAIAPQGGGTARFKSCFVSGQVMSLATGVVTLPLIWALLSKNAGKANMIFLIAMMVNLTVMIASTQRTALFSLAGAVVLLLYFYPSRGVISSLLGGAAIALIAWPAITFLISEEYLIQRLSNLESSSRFEFWDFGIEHGLKRPFLGHGAGAAGQEITLRFGMALHNAYLTVFYNLGIIGLMAYGGMVVAGLVSAYRLARNKMPKTKAVGSFLFATLAMLAVQGLAEGGIANTANQSAVMLYISLGLTASAMRMDETVEFEGLSDADLLSDVPQASVRRRYYPNYPYKIRPGTYGP